MKLNGFMKGMGATARAGLLVGVLIIVAGAIAAMWWVLTPKYQLLFGDLRETDAAEIAKSLDEWKVPHRFTEGGRSIEVAGDKVYETRMKLVSEGVPSGGHVGFELFNDSDFGVTEFAQRVNYQRAVQGELERSIAALPGVQSVRVHLTIRRPGLFVGQNDSSKASVVVGLAPGTTLAPSQVRGIRNLVASAVDGLSPTAVVVLGPGGVLQGGSTQADDSLMEQGEEQSTLETRIRGNINDLLGSVFKLKEFRVSVDVQLNFDKVHRVSERLIAQGEGGNGLLTRKRTTRTGSAATGTDEKPATSNQEEVDYAHGSEREELVKAPGSVERISIAVLVPSTLSSFELGRLERLISAAAGLDLERGDRLEITPLTQFDTSDATDAEVLATDATTAPMPSADPMWNGRGLPAVLWLVLIGLTGLVLGLLLPRLTRAPAKRLRPEERDAVLAKMRKWLVEDGEVA